MIFFFEEKELNLDSRAVEEPFDCVCARVALALDHEEAPLDVSNRRHDRVHAFSNLVRVLISSGKLVL